MCSMPRLGALKDRSPSRYRQFCRDEALAGVQVILPGFVNDPEVPGTLCFRVWKCDVYFQPLKGNLITSIVETNE
jgi:hypothetical protein